MPTQHCQVLGVPWVQPALDESTERVEDMLLIVLMSQPDDLSRLTGPASTELSDRIRRWAPVYFALSEGQRPSDPTYQSLMARFAEPLVVLPLEDYHTIPLLGAERHSG